MNKYSTENALRRNEDIATLYDTILKPSDEINSDKKNELITVRLNCLLNRLNQYVCGQYTFIILVKQVLFYI